MGDIPLLKLPASEKELDKIVQKFSAPPPSQEPKTASNAATFPSQDRPNSDPQGKKTAKRTRDSEGFISPPKHVTWNAPKANKESQIKDIPATDVNPDVDVNTLDPE
ncbi:hypothetical protein NPIL_408561, partial [Nephila pilipes]